MTPPRRPPDDAASRARGPVVTTRILSVRGTRGTDRPERLVAEEPLEIRAGGSGKDPLTLTVTMRTPGHDFELATGFLVSEGAVAGRDDVRSVRYCDPPRGEPQRFNVVTVGLARSIDLSALVRLVPTSSACGICGVASIEALESRCAPLPPGPSVPASVIARLPELLRPAQRLFDETGGLHATGHFTAQGELLVAREDVGRHNAMDKVVGHALVAGLLPLSESVLVVSGRVGFEIAQKAAAAGAPILCAVGAPTSLAVETARRLRVTLIGFVRPDGFNVYSSPERVILDR